MALPAKLTETLLNATSMDNWRPVRVDCGRPGTVNLPEGMQKSGANKTAIDGINDGLEKQIVVRQVKYLNNIVEQDHLSSDN